MTCQDSADSIVKGIAGPRGNRGANRGKSYSRVPADGGASGRFAEALTAAMDAAGVPQCFSKFSNCIYTDRQKLAVLVLMARHGISYGAVRRDLGMYRGFTDAIGLKRIPDGSTLCKFLKRIGTDVLGARAAIPVRRGRGNRGTVIHGPYRRMMDEALSDPDSAESRAYRRRAVIESTNFMIKRTAGPSVSARIPACRERQALLKAIAFNVLRVIRLGRIDRLRGGFQ
ncbi:MAG: hypothetical protein LKJ94_06260 [Candidatus Methanomethylophilus sp.]|jgi:hypothetical protein|nr:hypothetical protein [Methanomethylophilus sp.]MCI2075279.1 hypothetical protein [Methanomethylophilus sp.]MCI2092621.1 hypothetical protein [Methanomethylophilus sp.]